MYFNSMIFETDIEEIKNLLDTHTFTQDMYNQLEKWADYTIKHKYLWQGWVEKFLRERNIYPNSSILHGKKFQSTSTIKIDYSKLNGLEETRNAAIKEDIYYDDIIQQYVYV